MNRALPERIFISGFMGAGKSTVGSMLAKKFDQPFHDLDEYIQNRANKTIPELFADEGEEGFRKREQEALLDIIRHKKGVIALGGGTLQNQHLVDHVKVNGLLVFIDTSMDTILERITEGTHRPLLMDEQGKMKPKPVLKEELQALLNERQPFYKQAEVTIKNEDKPPEVLAGKLVKKIKYHVALY